MSSSNSVKKVPLKVWDDVTVKGWDYGSFRIAEFLPKGIVKVLHSSNTNEVGFLFALVRTVKLRDLKLKETK